MITKFMTKWTEKGVEHSKDHYSASPYDTIVEKFGSIEAANKKVAEGVLTYSISYYICSTGTVEIIKNGIVQSFYEEYCFKHLSLRRVEDSFHIMSQGIIALMSEYFYLIQRNGDWDTVALARKIEPYYEGCCGNEKDEAENWILKNRLLSVPSEYRDLVQADIIKAAKWIDNNYIIVRDQYWSYIFRKEVLGIF